MSQISFGDAEYAGKRKQTRRELFLAEMEQVVPWKVLLNLIEPFYPLAGRGRHPYPLETMLRVHLMQNWFGQCLFIRAQGRSRKSRKSREGPWAAFTTANAFAKG